MRAASRRPSDRPQQHPPAPPHDVDEMPHQLQRGHGMLGTLGGVVAERQPHPTAVLPHRRLLAALEVLVLAGGIVLVGHLPAVVDQALGVGGVVLLEHGADAVRAEVLAGIRPVDVVPQHVGAVAGDQVTQVTCGVGGVLLSEGTLGQLPVVAQPDRHRRRGMPVQAAGIVGPEPDPGAAGGLSPLTHQVALGTAVDGVAVAGAGRIPQTHPVVVLGGDHHIRPAGRHQLGDGGVGVEVLGLPLGPGSRRSRSRRASAGGGAARGCRRAGWCCSTTRRRSCAGTTPPAGSHPAGRRAHPRRGPNRVPSG